MPARLTGKLGRYEVPIFRPGRLAVDRSLQDQGIGGDLLLAAGERALAVAAEVTLAIDAKDEKPNGPSLKLLNLVERKGTGGALLTRRSHELRSHYFPVRRETEFDALPSRE